MDSELSRQLQKGWDGACRVLFGRELEGKLADYGPYLSEYLLPSANRVSHISGKPVKLASDKYPKKADFISFDEMGKAPRPVLSINQIKDLGSVLEAVGARAEYTGNKVLGNSAFVESSDIVLDGQFVANSTNIEQAAYLHSCFMTRGNSKYCYGCGWAGKSEFLVRSVGTLKTARCMENHLSINSSDCHFCFNCSGSHDLMFCFGQRNKSHMVGNLQLDKAKYASVKTGLMAEIAERLEKGKRFPSLVALVPRQKPSIPKSLRSKGGEQPEDLKYLDKGFASTMKLLLKVEVKGGIKDYEDWLESETLHIEKCQTPFGSTTSLPSEFFSVFSQLPHERVGTIEDTLAAGALALTDADIAPLDSIAGSLGKIAFFTAELCEGENQDVNGTPVAVSTAHTYRGFDSTNSEYTALASISLECKHVYGCGRILYSEFCAKCHNSSNLKRCFEMDCCTKCADCHFCHNCEGLSDCMFCFNMKGARHCIGNTQLSKEDYIKARDAILFKLADELDNTHGLKMSIYNVGAKR